MKDAAWSFSEVALHGGITNMYTDHVSRAGEVKRDRLSLRRSADFAFAIGRKQSIREFDLKASRRVWLELPRPYVVFRGCHEVVGSSFGIDSQSERDYHPWIREAQQFPRRA